MELSEQEVRNYLEQNGPGEYDVRLREEFKLDLTGEHTIIHKSDGIRFGLEQRIFGGGFLGAQGLQEKSFGLFHFSLGPIEIPYTAVATLERMRDLPLPIVKVDSRQFL